MWRTLERAAPALVPTLEMTGDSLLARLFVPPYLIPSSAIFYDAHVSRVCLTNFQTLRR
jgi:hypothetical protein